MSKSKIDNITKKELEELLEYAKDTSLKRRLLDADTALKSNEVASKTLKKLKWDDLMHILFLIIGCAISYFFTDILRKDNKTETISETHKLRTEINVLKSDFQKRLNEQNSTILELKNQIEDRKQLLEKE